VFVRRPGFPGVFGRPARRRARRRLTRVALAAVLVACVALVPAAWLEAGARGTPEPTLRAGATVEGRVQVRDGDTLVVGGVPVRLAGLHCPEAREPGGAAATARLRSLVAGRAVSCDLTGARTHDRQVGICRAADRDLAEALIREGACARCPRHDTAGRYRAAQGAAGPWRGALPRYC
jgi:endonuclease YncB( thermonuclease family)